MAKLVFFPTVGQRPLAVSLWELAFMLANLFLGQIMLLATSGSHS